jgi:hypothetical protein
MEKKCISCGMPMLSPTDHAMGDENREYCLYCARPDGEMKSYDEALESVSQFIQSTRSLSADEARRVAEAEMAELPAWRDGA